MKSNDITPTPYVSIIVPCKEIDEYAKECIEHCGNLDYPGSHYEILVLPDYMPTGYEQINGARDSDAENDPSSGFTLR